MSIKERLGEDIKSAMKAHDESRLGTLRYALAAIRQREVDTRRTLDESELIAILDKLIRQHRESAAAFAAGNRVDLVKAAEAEIALVSSYLPPRLSDAERDRIIEQAIDALGAQSLKDMGRVMNRLKEELAGRADLSKVSLEVRSRLGG
ncbi:GatB/Yqey domain-containing protein [mine drainage metagenome]|uniref:GatB/Yqey domain-containing protein n=1 Tax=mine drainage metagenome TaxID=410659 RepID=T1D2L8_9ZZZZ